MKCERGFAEDVVEQVEQMFSSEVSKHTVDSKACSSATDFTTVRASGAWTGAMRGQFTATRQIGQHWKSTEEARLVNSASVSAEDDEDDRRDAALSVAPSGWKKPPTKQVQLAFNGHTRTLHQLFARIDVTGEGTIPFAKLVSQLSQDEECAHIFELPLGNDRATIAHRHEALLTAFEDLPDAANSEALVDADGLVRLAMGASRDNMLRNGLVVSFTEPGTLGLKFSTNNATGAVEILAVHPATQAAQFSSLLQPGLAIQTVNGVNVLGLDYARTIAAIKAAGRPVELGFTREHANAIDHAAKSQSLEQAAELVKIERDLLQRRCDKLYTQLRRRRQREQFEQQEQQDSTFEMELVADDHSTDVFDLEPPPATPPPRDGSHATTKNAAVAAATGGLARIAQTMGGLAKKRSPVSRAGDGERTPGASMEFPVSPVNTATSEAETTTRV